MMIKAVIGIILFINVAVVLCSCKMAGMADEHSERHMRKERKGEE